MRKLDRLVAAAFLVFAFARLPAQDLPPVSGEFSRALGELKDGRARIAVAGVMRADEARPLHDAFWSAVPVENLSVSETLALLDAPVFTFHPEKQSSVYARAHALAGQTTGVSSTLALAACLQLPRPPELPEAANDVLARTFLDRPELPLLLRSPHAGLVLSAVARVPVGVAAASRERIFSLAVELAPESAASGATGVEPFWSFARKLGGTSAENETLRQTLVRFLEGVQSSSAGDPEDHQARVVTRALAKLRDQDPKVRLNGRPAPALDFIWASRPGLHALSDLRGQVVVLKFWATWCGPCVQGFPDLKALCEYYRDSPVAIVGVTSPQGVVAFPGGRNERCDHDPVKESRLLEEYRAAQKLPWTLALSSQPVFNPDYGVDALPHLTIIAPDGVVRHAYLRSGTSLAEQRRLIDSVLREFSLPTPGGGVVP